MPPLAEPLAGLEITDMPVASRLIDTHAHLHFDAFIGSVDQVLHNARETGVGKMITVGVTTADSRKAVELAATYENVWAAVGIHPHDAGEAVQGTGYLKELASRRKVVAIGECGLDYYKAETTPEQQAIALRNQIEIALELDKPLIFHVREAFEDFFAIIKNYPAIRGVVHSFTGTQNELDHVLETGLHVAVNGIITFNKTAELQAAIKSVPGDRLLLETDCPFLSPVPYRGKTNEPARVSDIAEFVAGLRGETAGSLAKMTTSNAERLFELR